MDSDGHIPLCIHHTVHNDSIFYLELSINCIAHIFWSILWIQAYLPYIGIFGVRKSNPYVILLQDIKNRDPILTGRFHANISTVVFGKPIAQLLQTFSKRRKASLLIFCTIIWISNTDTGIDPSFVDIKSATVIFENFKRQ